MFKGIIALGIIGMSSMALTFGQITDQVVSQVAPDAPPGWEKFGIVSILLGAIAYLLAEKRNDMKKLIEEVTRMSTEIARQNTENKKLRASLKRYETRNHETAETNKAPT